MGTISTAVQLTRIGASIGLQSITIIATFLAVVQNTIAAPGDFTAV